MSKDLESDPEKHGFRGARSYIAAGDASGSNELMTNFYFDSHEALHTWAHGEAHMKGWHWWNATHKKWPYIGM